VEFGGFDEDLSVYERGQLFRKRIAHWAIDTNVSRDIVNKLLAFFEVVLVSFLFYPRDIRHGWATQAK
jgi:hypothetical protein